MITQGEKQYMNALEEFDETIVEEFSARILEIFKDALFSYKDIIQNRIIATYNEDDDEYDYVFHGSEPDNLLELETVEDILLEKYSPTIEILLAEFEEKTQQD